MRYITASTARLPAPDSGQKKFNSRLVVPIIYKESFGDFIKRHFFMKRITSPSIQSKETSSGNFSKLINHSLIRT
jgi:hypothetical protein